MTAGATLPPSAAAAPIGVIGLQTIFTKIRGHIRNPSTFDYPVIYEVVEEATAERVVTQADPSLVEPFCQAARKLQARGAAAITTGCGFLVLFQQQLADSVTVPLFASSLIQLPMVHRMMAADQHVGVLTAKQASLTPRHLAAIGAGSVPVRVAGMEDQQEFREVLLEGRRAELDVEQMRAEVLTVAGRLAGDQALGAVVLECTDLVPFASDIQRLLAVPVFDIVTLTNMVHATLNRHPYR
jgi:Asp/Glu/hydantoin racemase